MNRGSIGNPPSSWIIIGVLVLVSLYVLYSSSGSGSGSKKEENEEETVGFDEELLRQQVKKSEGE